MAILYLNIDAKHGKLHSNMITVETFLRKKAHHRIRISCDCGQEMSVDIHYTVMIALSKYSMKLVRIINSVAGKFPTLLDVCG